MGSDREVFEERAYTELVWVKFHIHSTTTSEIMERCKYCCLLYFSSLKLPLLPEHAGFVQAPLSCVSGALFSALLVLSPLHKKPTVYISMQKVAKRTISPQQALLWTEEAQVKHYRCTGKRAILQWQGCQISEESLAKRDGAMHALGMPVQEGGVYQLLFACTCCPVLSETAVACFFMQRLE